jgi:hypothetical protein
MEARFADTSGTFANNLTNMAILADRDGASGVLGLSKPWRNPVSVDA